MGDVEIGPGLRGFWHFYLSEHAERGTRAWHVAGTTLAVALVIAAIALSEPWFLLAALVSGYAFAWIGHFFVEHNRPATFKYPIRSFLSDWVLWAKTLTGRIGRDLDKYGLR